MTNWQFSGVLWNIEWTMPFEWESLSSSTTRSRSADDPVDDLVIYLNPLVLKPSNATKTTVMLSIVFFATEVLRILSTALPHCSWTFDAQSSRTPSQTHWMTSADVHLSKIPSQANKTKSISFWILNFQISGSAIITLEFPPYFYSFASMSPNDLETDNLPGNTLCGPRMTSFPDPSSFGTTV